MIERILRTYLVKHKDGFVEKIECHRLASPQSDTLQEVYLGGHFVFYREIEGRWTLIRSLRADLVDSIELEESGPTKPRWTEGDLVTGAGSASALYRFDGERFVELPQKSDYGARSLTVQKVEERLATRAMIVRYEQGAL